MKARTVIRSSQSGWVVYFDNDVNNFKVFRSDEPERFMKFICEVVAGINVDQMLQQRNREIADAQRRLDALQKP